MHILQLIAGVLLVSLTFATARAASDEQNALIVSMPISDVLSFYEELLGQKIVITSEVKTMTAKISANIQKKSKSEALKILDDALAKQASAEIYHDPDGRYLARRITPKK